jgi:glycosyltransferase involved in cell wall biosynthesis
MRIGAGVQNKVLEYMALGLTCITTSIGLEGINATPGKEVLVADTPEQYAMAILSILEDDSEREVMAIAGRELIQKEYSWSFQLSDYVVEIDTLIG